MKWSPSSPARLEKTSVGVGVALCPSIQIPASAALSHPAMGKGEGEQTAAVARAHLQHRYRGDGPGADGSCAVKSLDLFCPAVKPSACRDHRLALWGDFEV